MLIGCLSATPLLHAQPSASKGTPLFNGENFDGWTKRNGEAEYRIEGNEIVGISAMGTPNTFLCTEQPYVDFILDLEVKVDPNLNSGIQIRSNSLPDYQDGRVHGYQVEIDPSARSWSGGIYDEARRGWLYPLTRNEPGRQAFKIADWNHYHIEAIGSEIRVWINGVQTANLVDAMTREGFIGLQVHSIHEESQEGAEVRWRNIYIQTEDLVANRWPVQPHLPEMSYLVNTLTEHEQRTGWRLLWDGETTDGWRGARMETFPEKGWQIDNGVLTVLETGGAESEAGGDIITEQQFSSFELHLEFMITEGANSGIKYFVDPELNRGTGSAIGLEYQILDDEHHPDAKMGVEGNRTLASLYDLIPAHNLSHANYGKRFRGIGTWNQARIVVRGDHVEHWLNGFKMVEYERSTPMYRALVAYSKYAVWEGFGELPTGHILLQDHGNRVSFRSIKIREIN